MCSSSHLSKMKNRIADSGIANEGCMELGKSGLFVNAHRTDAIDFNKMITASTISPLYLRDLLKQFQSPLATRQEGVVIRPTTVVLCVVTAIHAEHRVVEVSDLCQVDALISLGLSAKRFARLHMHDVVGLMQPLLHHIKDALLLHVPFSSQLLCFGPCCNVAYCKHVDFPNFCCTAAIDRFQHAYCAKHLQSIISSSIAGDSLSYQPVNILGKFGNVTRRSAHGSLTPMQAREAVKRELSHETATDQDPELKKVSSSGRHGNGLSSRASSMLKTVEKQAFKRATQMIHVQTCRLADAYRCVECGFVSTTVDQKCEQQGHTVEPIRVREYSYRCTACWHTQWSLSKQSPQSACRKCGSLAWASGLPTGS